MTETVPAEKPTRTPRDMVLSMAVLLIPVLLIVLAYRYLHNGDQPVQVDPAEDISAAQRAGIGLLPPATAPEGWVIINSQFRDGVLRIGYLDADQNGAQLVQAKTDLAATETARPDETMLIGRSGDVTVVLRGKNVDLTPLAQLLQIPVSPAGGGK